MENQNYLLEKYGEWHDEIKKLNERNCIHCYFKHLKFKWMICFCSTKFSIKNLIFFCLDKWVLQSCEVQSNSRLRIHICFSVGYTMKLIKGTVIHFYFKHLEFKWKCFCLKISCFNKKSYHLNKCLRRSIFYP